MLKCRLIMADNDVALEVITIVSRYSAHMLKCKKLTSYAKVPQTGLTFVMSESNYKKVLNRIEKRNMEVRDFDNGVIVHKR